MRIRIIKKQGSYNIGDILDVTPNIAHGLIDSGVGVISKDITSEDYQTKTPKRKRKR